MLILAASCLVMLILAASCLVMLILAASCLVMLILATSCLVMLILLSCIFFYLVPSPSSLQSCVFIVFLPVCYLLLCVLQFNVPSFFAAFGYCSFQFHLHDPWLVVYCYSLCPLCVPPLSPQPSHTNTLTHQHTRTQREVKCLANNLSNSLMCTNQLRRHEANRREETEHEPSLAPDKNRWGNIDRKGMLFFFPLRGRPRCFVKSPTAQTWSIPSVSSCIVVTGSLGGFETMAVVVIVVEKCCYCGLIVETDIVKQFYVSMWTHSPRNSKIFSCRSRQRKNWYVCNLYNIADSVLPSVELGCQCT